MLINNCAAQHPAKKTLLLRSFQLLCSLLLSITIVHGATKTSVATGNWSATATWGGSLPVAGDDIIIANGTTVTITASPGLTFASVTVGQGTSGILQFSTTAATLLVSGNVTIAVGGTLKSGASGSVTHTLSVGGNIINNGTFNARAFTTNFLAISFTGSTANQTFTNNNTITGSLLSSITVNNTFSGGTVTIPSGLSVADASTLTLASGILVIGGAGVITYGTTVAGAFTCVRTNGSMTATTAAYFTGSTGVKTYTYNGAGSQTTGPELTTATPVNISALTVNNSALSLTLNAAVNVSATLTLTNGIINTSNTNLLTLSTAAATWAGTLSATSYVNGPLARVFAASRTAAGTFTTATQFPVGKNSAFLPVFIDPTTTAAGTVTIKLETMDDVAGNFTWVSSPLVYTGYKKLSRDWQLTYSGIGAVTACFAGVNTATGTFAVPALDAGTSYGLATNPDASGNYTDGGTLGLRNPSTTLWTTYSAVPANVTGLASATRFTVTTEAASASILAPGGVGSQLKLWLKADSIFSATNNNPVSAWTNSAAGFTAPTQTVALNQPTWLDGTNAAAVNHNPVVSFNPTNSNNLKFAGMLFSASKYSFFAVANLNATGGTTSLLGGPANFNIIYVSTDARIRHEQNNVAGGILTNANTVAANQPGLYNISFTGGTSAAAIYNGKTQLGNVPITFSSSMNTASTLGTFGTSFWNGTMSEVMMYNTDVLTPLATQQIQSYLAFKYGITLDQTPAQDYVASGGGSIKMWDHTRAGTSFNNNIFGIGTDVHSLLNQKISQPTSTDGKLLTLATTNDFTSANQGAGRTSLSDMNFETVCDNQGANTWTAANTLVGFKKLTREWQVQETGAIGTVFVQFDTANAAFPIPARNTPTDPFYIITDPNGDGNFSDGSATALTNTSGSLWSGSIDFTDLSRFTIATSVVDAGLDTFLCTSGSLLYALKGGSIAAGVWTAATGNPAGVVLGSTSFAGTTGTAQADFTTAAPGLYQFVYTASGMTDTMVISLSNCKGPGGVFKNLSLWNKANTGITLSSGKVSQWNDQSLYGNSFVQATAVNQPPMVASSNLMNYNPALLFSGNQFLDAARSVLSPAINSIVSVFTTASTGGTWADLFSVGKTASTHSMEWRLNNALSMEYGKNSTAGFLAMATAATIPANTTTLSTVTENSTTNGANIYLNGALNTTATVNRVPDTTGLLSCIGARIAASRAFGWVGLIPEVIAYNSVLTDAERKKVESYLALKYGFMLDNSAGGTAGDMLLSDGTTVWSANASPAFHTQVIGLIRDDTAGILQKQSHTQDDGVKIFLSSLAADNASNTGNISNNLSSVVIGHNTGAIISNTTDPKPGGVDKISGRTWKITKTNFADPFSIELAWDLADVFDITKARLLVSADGNFSGATVYDNTSGLTFAQGSIIVGNITSQIPSGTSFITIGFAPLATLPVSITAFNANVINNNKVSVNWQTSSEINSDYFTVERSAGNNTWKTVAKVKAAGNSSSPLNYNAEDKNPLTGISYYRLKQADLDGHYTYSVVRTVKIENADNKSFSIYPNPVTSQLTLKGDAAELKSVKIYNIAGQDVSNAVKTIDRTSGTLVLDVSMLPNGAYTIKTANSISKMLKQ